MMQNGQYLTKLIRKHDVRFKTKIIQCENQKNENMSHSLLFVLKNNT